MRRVMIVDDDARSGHYWSMCFAQKGYAVSEASDGLDALKELVGVHPDFVVLDVMIPAMDGRAFAAACHSRTEGRKVPILLMSTSPKLWQMADQLRRFNVRGFMSKAVDVDIFVAAVGRLTAPGPVLVACGSPWAPDGCVGSGAVSLVHPAAGRRHRLASRV
jgi:two-component system response regulator MprA